MDKARLKELFEAYRENNEYEFLDNSEYFLTEGWFGDVVDKFKNVVKGGVKTFVSWVKNVYSKLLRQ